MKATFEMRVPPAGGEPVPYVVIDPDDTGLNTVGHQATENDKSRFSAEYEAFEKEQDEKEEAGEPAVAPQDPLADLPVSVKASMPLGREDEYAAQYRGTAPIPVTEPVTAVKLVSAAPDAAPPLIGDGEDGDDEAGELDTLTAAEAIADIKEETDKAKLQRWYDEEDSREVPRKTVLDAITHRQEQLNAGL